MFFDVFCTKVVAHPTELKITYERDCSEVIENGAENYMVNAFVSGGVPPYQVQVNEGEFFEVAENVVASQACAGSPSTKRAWSSGCSRHTSSSSPLDRVFAMASA